MADNKSPGAPRRPLPRWKKALIGFSAVALVLGAGLHGYSYLRGATRGVGPAVSSNPSQGDGGLTTSLVEGGPSTPSGGPRDSADAEAAPASDTYAPFFLNGGLSFFVGFCMGYAVRTFFKVSALFVGVAALIFFGLQYTGLIPGIDWHALEGRFQDFTATVGRQLGNFQAFVQGHLPSSAAATAGAFTGWKKN